MSSSHFGVVMSCSVLASVHFGFNMDTYALLQFNALG
jgi:hypothetical protein